MESSDKLANFSITWNSVDEIMNDLSNNFSRSEFECKCGCGFDTVDVELIKVLEEARTYFDSPISINSGNRCEEHNKAMGGSPNSQHLTGKAADIRVVGISSDEVFSYFAEKYLDKYGKGDYNGRVHIDVRSGGGVQWAG